MTTAPRGRRKIIDVLGDESAVRFEHRAVVSDDPADLAALSVRPDAMAVMVWDEDLALPDPTVVERLMRSPCHVWHAGQVFHNDTARPLNRRSRLLLQLIENSLSNSPEETEREFPPPFSLN